MHPNLLEEKVLELLLAGENETLEILRRQLEVAKVKSREFSGVGFFLDFDIPVDTLPVTESKNFTLGDVHGKASNVKAGVGFVLFIRNGFLKMLEGYTYDEPWPNSLDHLVLTYESGNPRDMSDVRSQIK